MIIATNLFHNPTSAYSSKVLSYAGPVLLTHRNVQVVKNPRGSWDYIFAGAVITQRSGFDKRTATELIDDILDGREARPDSVVEHLKTHGFQALSYGKAGEEGAS